MSFSEKVAQYIAAIGLIAIGGVGVVFGVAMAKHNVLVGFSPLLSSTFLVLFSGLSLLTKEMDNKETSPSADRGSGRWAALPVMGALIAYLFVIRIIGFDLDTGLLIVVVLFLSGVRKVRTIGATLIVLLSIAFLFQDALGVALPRGVF